MLTYSFWRFKFSLTDEINWGMLGFPKIVTIIYLYITFVSIIHYVANKLYLFYRVDCRKILSIKKYYFLLHVILVLNGCLILITTR